MAQSARIMHHFKYAQVFDPLDNKGLACVLDLLSLNIISIVLIARFKVISSVMRFY